MSEELENKTTAQAKKRGRPRKNVEEVENKQVSKEKTAKKESKKEAKKEIKTEETITQAKKRGRPRKNVETIEKQEGKEKITKKETKKDSTKKEIEKKTEIKKDKIETKSKTKAKDKSKVEEIIEEVEEKALLKSKSEDLSINNEKLEKIEQEIKKQKTISVEKRKKINKVIFKNVIIAILVVLYFLFVNLGYANLELEKYLVDLKVFSIVFIMTTIVLFEIAYKKDSGEITIFGIESLALSIVTLLGTYYSIVYTKKYPYIVNCVSILFALYYIIKSTVIYLKMKKKAIYASGDIHKIVKK